MCVFRLFTLRLLHPKISAESSEVVTREQGKLLLVSDSRVTTSLATDRLRARRVNDLGRLREKVKVQ